MDTEFSRAAFFEFLDYLSDKGLITHQTVRGWRSAALKLMEDLSETEEADVRTIDIDLAARKTANRGAGSVSPNSLKTYQQRVVIAIREFTQWRTNPADYKPRGVDNRNTPEDRRLSRQKRPKPTDPATLMFEQDVAQASAGLTLSYPLRSDFLAQVVIPRDLNTIEAKRLGAFLLTIAVDYQPE